MQMQLNFMSSILNETNNLLKRLTSKTSRKKRLNKERTKNPIIFEKLQMEGKTVIPFCC